MVAGYDWFQPSDLPTFFHALQKVSRPAILVGGQSLTFWVDYFKIPVPKGDTPNTAIVTYKTQDGRTLFVDFMGTLIGLTNEEIRNTAVEFEHPEYGLIRILHPTLVLKSRIVNLHRLQSKRDTNGIEQARLAVSVAKAFFENYVSLGLAGKNPDRYLIDRVTWLGKLALSDAGIYVYTQWEIDVMAAVPNDLIANKKFHTEHWPRLDARIRAKRERRLEKV